MIIWSFAPSLPALLAHYVARPLINSHTKSFMDSCIVYSIHICLNKKIRIFLLFNAVTTIFETNWLKALLCFQLSRFLWELPNLGKEYNENCVFFKIMSFDHFGSLKHILLIKYCMQVSVAPYLNTRPYILQTLDTWTPNKRRYYLSKLPKIRARI